MGAAAAPKVAALRDPFPRLGHLSRACCLRIYSNVSEAGTKLEEKDWDKGRGEALMHCPTTVSLRHQFD